MWAWTCLNPVDYVPFTAQAAGHVTVPVTTANGIRTFPDWLLMLLRRQDTGALAVPGIQSALLTRDLGPQSPLLSNRYQWPTNIVPMTSPEERKLISLLSVRVGILHADASA